MADLKGFKDKDLYDLLEIKDDATSKEIKKAYRKKALKLHPDKNPDNPRAAAMFNELSEALKILTDLGARAAYDHMIRAKRAAAARTAKLDDKRKKVKLDLEAREKAADNLDQDTRKAARTLEQEIDRLREEGSQILRQEQQAMKDLLREEAAAGLHDTSSETVRLHVRWKPDNGSNITYTREKLLDIFQKYGNVVAMIVSHKKKKCSAIVEFRTVREAEKAYESEISFPENPLTVSWLSGKSSGTAGDIVEKLGSKKAPIGQDWKGLAPKGEEDFEALVLQKMRDVQEQKRKQTAKMDER